MAAALTLQEDSHRAIPVEEEGIAGAKADARPAEEAIRVATAACVNFMVDLWCQR